MSNHSFQAASDALSDFDIHVSELAYPFTQFLPVTGASISTFGPLLGAGTISATDAQARRVDELQFDLGEGPCWDALATKVPVLESNLATRTSASWPAFSDAIRAENVGALFAFPVVFGPLEIGAVDLYCIDPVTLTPDQQHEVMELSAMVGRRVLGHAIQAAGTTTDTSMFSRRFIHQATGMVLAQLGITAADAHLIIKARAFAESRSMQEISADIVARRIRFS